VLRSVRELEQFRARTRDGLHCGRIKDVYFDDSTWKVTHLVLSIEPSVTGPKQVLLDPSQVDLANEETGFLPLRVSADVLEDLPLASSVLPVCKQYEAFAYSSPGARKHRISAQLNPHLRSARAVVRYRLEVAGESGGNLADFLFDGGSGDIRYLGIEQELDRKKMRFFVLPQAVERITWATQRVILRELHPVAASLAEDREAGESSAAA
jgi:hypothetical protein